jgi:outer membrane murein-binding lipoprotein Lpp
MRTTILLLAVCLVGTTYMAGCVKRHRAPGVAVVEEVSDKKTRTRVLRAQAPPQAAQDAAVDADIVPEKPAPTRGIAWQVKGWGRDQTEAEADAVGKATNGLADYLQHLNPPLALTPSTAYVRERLIRGAARRLEDLDQVIDKGPEPIKMQCWSMNLVVTPQDYAELVQREKRLHVEQERSRRMLISARVLAGVLVLLAGTIALIRLREWSCCRWKARTIQGSRRGAKAKALVVACVVILAVVGFLFLA